MTIYEVRKSLASGKTIYDLPLRVTYYDRVSTEKLEQKSSLINQDMYFKNKILSNPNWILVEGYTDDGITGTSTKKREDFKQMIEDAKNDKFDLILTKEVCRFARNTLDTLQITRDLLLIGKGVYFELDNINTLEQDGELRLTIMASLAQDESRKTSERTKFGFNRAIERGRVLGNNVIWGYEKDKCKLKIQEDEARVVRKIFEIYSKGNIGIRALSKKLVEEGIYARNGNPLSYSTIRGILVNPKYKGYYCGKKTEKLDFITKKQIWLPENEWVTYKASEDIVPQIVDEEIWEKCNKILHTKHERFVKEGTNWNSEYMYSKLFICAYDGRPYWRRKYRRNSGEEYWGCSEYLKKGKCNCENNTYIATKDMDKILIDVFDQLRNNKDKIMKNMLKVNNKAFKQNETNFQDDDKIKQEIQELELNKKSLIKLYSLNKIDENEFEELNNDYKEKIVKLQNKLSKMKNKLVENQFEGNKQKIKDFFDFEEFELTRSFLLDKVDKIYVTQLEKNHLKVKINFHFGLNLSEVDKKSICLELIMCILGALALNFTPNLEPCFTISGSSRINSSIEGVTIP